MTKALVTDNGLARRLGETVFIRKKGREEKGRLVYYPHSFGVLQPNKKVTPIRAGDVVSLHVGSGIASYGPHYREHEYVLCCIPF